MVEKDGGEGYRLVEAISVGCRYGRSCDNAGVMITQRRRSTRNNSECSK